MSRATTFLDTEIPTNVNQNPDRRTTMYDLHEVELAREHMNARLSQARAQRLGHQLATARRLSRKAERAAAAARLALARAL